MLSINAVHRCLVPAIVVAIFNVVIPARGETPFSVAWTRQLGTNLPEQGNGVSADGLGNAYISGYTAGSLSGTSNGDFDAFVSKYTAAGTLAWTKQIGTALVDQAFGVSADGLGSLYVTGSTQGAL